MATEPIMLTNQEFDLSIGQELMPKIAYAGQNLNTPVSKGITPIQPHTPTICVAANAINTNPTTTRIILSGVPTLNFMIFSNNFNFPTT